MVYSVTHVRMEWSADRAHEHIAQVRTTAGVVCSRAQVVNSINQGNTWRTSAQGYSETIRPVSQCPRSRCTASPYIRTNPNSVTVDNLENLPRF
jgi:hypothetical protein